MEVFESYASLELIFCPVVLAENSETLEEKTDEFFTHRNTRGIFRLEDDMSRVRSSSPSWIRHYTQTSSFSLGNYYMQNLMHHPWASSSIYDCRVSLVSLDTVLNKCQGGEKQPHIPHVKSCPASMGRAAANEKMVFDSNRLAFRKIPPPSEMLDEDIRFLAKVLSNSRPPIEFVYSADEATEARNRNDTQHAFRRQQQEATALFDGAHGEYLLDSDFLCIKLIKLIFVMYIV